MGFDAVLIANRGEIAVRIARAVAGLGLRSAAVYSEDDARSLHTRAADQAVALTGIGAKAYLDGEAIIRAAKAAGCQAIHPGYGFLSEQAASATWLCAEHGLVFIGPRPEALALFGDKAQARALAKAHGVPLAEGTEGATSLDDAKAFFAGLGAGAAMMIKALAGGGGRGMRLVRGAGEVEEAYLRCCSEAKAAFGDSDVYVERVIEQARHIEVQVLGDAGGALISLGDRDCSLQRRRQKLIEIAPSPNLSRAMRSRLADAALGLARAAKYESLGTFEFLVEAGEGRDGFVFIEANARLQVEHTVTEEVSGVDLVQAQIEIARGRSLADLGLAEAPASRGYAIQLRVNTETMDAVGNVKPTGGTLSAFEPPSGPGVRVDACGYAGYTTNPNFDSLLAKVIVHERGPSFADAVRKAGRALDEFRLEGVATNIPILRAILRRPELAAGAVTTLLVEEQIGAILADAAAGGARYFEDAAWTGAGSARAERAAPEGSTPLPAPTQGLVIAINVEVGDLVRPGQTVAVLESMKMEHLVEADAGGRVCEIAAEVGQVLFEGDPVVFVEPADVGELGAEMVEAIDLDAIRPDLAEAFQRIGLGLDENRPGPTEKRHKLGMRTVRENVDALVDPGSFIEYGALAIAAQRRRRSVEDLMVNTPADGLITGIGAVNGDLFDETRSRCAILAYDYTVLAGTQGGLNHKKTDRIIQVIKQEQLPVIWFAEGGGGRPGDTDGIGATGLDASRPSRPSPRSAAWRRGSAWSPAAALPATPSSSAAAT